MKPKNTAPVRRGAALAARLGMEVYITLPEAAESTESYQKGRKDLEAYSRHLTAYAAWLAKENDTCDSLTSPEFDPSPPPSESSTPSSPSSTESASQ